MKRDFDLIRTILFAAESAPADTIINKLDLPEDCKPDDATLIGHISLLIDGGFLKGEVTHYLSGEIEYEIELTWKGQDFIGLIRENTLWERVKRELLSKTSAVTLEVIKEFLVKAAKAAIPLS
jgi:hypothetical protein